jgi:hypothetical protein
MSLFRTHKVEFDVNEPALFWDIRTDILDFTQIYDYMIIITNQSMAV